MKFTFNKVSFFNIVDKYFLYFALFFVLVIIGIGFNYIALPVWRDIRSVDVVKVKQQQKQIDDLQLYLVKLKQMRDSYAKVDYNDVKRLEEVLPHSYDEQTLYLEMESFIKRSGLTLTSLNVTSGASTQAAANTSRRAAAATNTTDTAGRVVEITVDAGVRGLDTYEQFKNFLQLLEQESPMMQLSSLTYPISGASTSFSLKSYYLSE